MSTQALRWSTILTDLRQDLDEETAADSFWTDARLVRIANRINSDIFNFAPVRTAAFTITGDGTSTEFATPEEVSDFHGVFDGIAVIPKISLAGAIRENGIQSLIYSYWGDYGFAFAQYAGRQKIKITPTVASGETRTVWCFANCGKVKETSYSTGTVSVTKGDATVTGSGTAWTTGTNAVIGESIEINGNYYVIDSITSATALELTENVREATASGLSYIIGDSLGLLPSLQELFVAGVKSMAWEQRDTTSKADRYAATYAGYKQKILAKLEIAMTTNVQLGSAY